MKYPLFTVAFNAPEFLPYQKRLIDKFMPEFELFVINNCVQQFTTNISKVCEQNNIRYIDLWHNHHDNPNNSHSYALNYGIDLLCKEFGNPKKFGVIDSDVFPIKPIDDFSCDAYSAQQSRGPYTYFSPCIALFNTNNFTDWNMDWRGYWFEGGAFKADNGGSTYFFIERNKPQIEWMKQELISVEHGGLDIVGEPTASSIRNGPPGMHFECWDRKFIHHYAGSNWCGWPKEFIEAKKRILFDYLDTL